MIRSDSCFVALIYGTDYPGSFILNLSCACIAYINDGTESRILYVSYF